MFGTDILPDVQPMQDAPNKDRPKFSQLLKRLAYVRNETPTADVQAAFKEGVRSPIREAAAY